MFKDEILENERRMKIYAAIEATPGIHLRELHRTLGMPLTSLEYHLSYMTRRKILFAETEGHHKRYYTKPLDFEDKKVLTALRQKRMREIVLTILKNGKAKNQLLAECLKMSHSTLSSYLKYLVNKNILARERIGYEYLYTVRDEDRVAKVLTAYKPSFLDKLVDRVLETWMETHYPKIESRPRALYH
jgi:predicted transcriptional regulator